MSGIWSDGESGSTMNDTHMLFCAAEALWNITTITDPPILNVILRYVQLLFCILLFTLGAPLNIIVLVLLAKCKKLRTLSFSIAFQVVLVDLGIVLTVIVPRIIVTAANRWLFGEYICAIQGAFHFITYLLRIFLMFLLVIDRFLTVFVPYKYPKYRLKVISTTSMLIWLATGFTGIILLPKMLDCYAYSPLIYQCHSTPTCSSICNIVLNFINAIVLFSIIIPTLLYGSLFWKARKANRAAALAANDSSKSKATITFLVMFITLFATIVPLFLWIIISNIIGELIAVLNNTIAGVITGNVLSIF